MTPESKEKTKNLEIQAWIDEISAASKREKEWREEARKILEIHNGAKPEEVPFNILYSNTETLQPALYNSTPRPVVKRRFKDDNPLGKAAAEVGQRLLEFLLDTNSEEYATFDDSMGDAVLDGLLPGRGATWVKFDASIIGEEGSRVVKYATVCFESMKWDRWIFGYAKKWEKVPWVAKEHDITEKEATERFGKIASELTYAPYSDQKEDEKEKGEQKTDEEKKTCRVYEIWDRDGGKKIRFVAPTYPYGYLKVDDDPLGLTGFYPMPKPLRFVRKANDLAPTPLYTLYKNQAEELNRISVRINRVVEALKVRGVYNSQLGEVGTLLEQDDNALVPAENVAAFIDNGGLEKSIWLIPIEKLVAVLQQLLLAREQCKQVIYEITGISDILRGATKASETLGAQQIKESWAGLRLKRSQRDVQIYARNTLRIALEIAATKIPVNIIAQMTGLPFPTQQQKDAANGQLAAARAVGMQPPPEAMQIAQQFSWEEVVGALQNDTQRQFSIDIETNSTIDLEATEDQKNISEFMGAFGQVLNGIGPLVQEGILPFQAAQAMLLAVARRFRFGGEVEDYIKAMQQPPPKDENAGEKVKMEGERAQMAVERKQMQAEKVLAKKEHNLEMREMKLQMEQEKFAFEKDMAAQSFDMASQQVDLKMQARNQEIEHNVTKQNMQTEGKVRSLLGKQQQGVAASRGEDVKQVQALSQAVTQLATTTQQLLQALAKQAEQQAQMTERLISAVTAEKEFVRDPQTGRVSGARVKVVK